MAQLARVVNTRKELHAALIAYAPTSDTQGLSNERQLLVRIARLQNLASVT
jgi:hypothetical protein